MRKICFGIILLWWAPLCMYGQQTVIDSLRRIFQAEQDPQKKLDIYYDMALGVKELNFEAVAAYCDTLETMSNTIHSTLGNARALNLRAVCLKEKGDVDAALVLLRRELPLRMQLREKKGIAQLYNDLGNCFSEIYQIDSATVYYLKAIEIHEKEGNMLEVAIGYSNLGNLYVDQKIFDKGIDMLEKALKIRLDMGEEKKAVYTYNNLAVAYGTKGDIDKAMAYSQKGIALALKADNKFVAGVILGGMCHLMHEKGRNLDAIPLCEQSIRYLEEARRRNNQVFPLVNLAIVYNDLKQPRKALEYAQKGYAIMLERKLMDPLEVYYEEMADSYEQLGNYKEALGWIKKLMVLDDSLFQADNVKNIADIETRYQTQKKEAEIATQRLQIAEQQGNLFRQRAWIFGLAAALVALTLLGFLLYNRYRLRQKVLLDAAVIREQKLGLSAVIEAQEAERKRIAKDLHDGIAQELVALKLGLNALQNNIAAMAPNEAARMDDLLAQIDASCSEVRNISHTMMPPALEQHGLAPSLEMLLRNTMKNSGIAYQFEYHNLPDQMEERVEIGVYRIAQELVNNIIKHARAGKVFIQLYLLGNNLVLRVEDDGQGFDFDTARRKGSMGLLNILSRVGHLGGAFHTEPAQPHGSIATIRIPVV